MSNEMSSSRRFEEEGKGAEIAEDKSSEDFGSKDLMKALGECYKCMNSIMNDLRK
jgi:hypothetical protein